jgi:aryl-alcohol dehydrogenase-like predicted oxidoreductase
VVEFREIGPLSVSTVGLGCNNFGRKLSQADSEAVVHAAIDEGVNFFDTSDVYGWGDHAYSGTGRSEEFLGAALKGRRDDAIIATKFGISMSKTDRTMRGGGRDWVRRACEGSLRRLGTDRIDLYQMHRPDRDSHVSETLAVLAELVAEGKVREIGCSNFSGEQLIEAAAVAADLGLGRFRAVQNEYSLLVRGAEETELPACEDLDISFVPFFPLASGLLTGKYQKGEPAPEGTRLAFWQTREWHSLEDGVIEKVDRLSAFAKAAGHSLLELAISWILAHTQISSVVAGATTPRQVHSNVAAAAWVLSADELSAANAI